MAFIIVAIILILVDQAVKFWTMTNLELGQSADLIQGVISLTREHNTGVAFSLFKNSSRWILAAISIVIAIVLIIFLIKRVIKGRGQRLTLLFVIAGAISNALDRILRGYVVDMFKLEFVRFGIFNVADICVVCGIILFAILLLKGEPKAAKKSVSKKPKKKSEFERNFDLPVDDPPFPNTDTQSSKQEFTFEDIMKEYGEDNDDL